MDYKKIIDLATRLQIKRESANEVYQIIGKSDCMDEINYEMLNKHVVMIEQEMINMEKKLKNILK